VNPLDQKRHYLINTDASYAHLRALALTVPTNALKTIKVAFAYPDAPTPAAQVNPVVTPAPVTQATGCLYSNPACSANQNCVNNACVSSTPVSGPVCGNGKIEGAEQCDGGDHCSSSCSWTTKYPAQSFNQPGGSSDYTVGIGDKIAIGDGINIRIDDITNFPSPNGTRVSYSIWGKDTGNACKLISASGEFWTSLADYKFREFADSFLELISVDGTKATIRQYYGNAARVRCDAIAGWKQSLACSLYPANDHYYVNNGYDSSFYYGAGDQLAAEYYADAFRNCSQAYLKKIPALAAITPIGRSYRQLYSALEDVNAYSTDYERVFISKSNFDPSSSDIAQKLSWISDGSCPMQENAIAHELAHLLFARTFLQGSYDSGTKTEWTDANAYQEPGSTTAQEGFAQYMTTFISKDSPSAAAKTSNDYWSAFCGKDRLLNAHPGDFYDFSKATDAQMTYKNIFDGSGYQANTYQAGYCFYKRIDDDCGDASLTDLLNKAIQYDGSTASHPTMFKYLSDSCGAAKVQSIMNDFGFDPALVTMTQKWPNTGFPNGLDQPGCLSD
jgi:hypothetical protein